ncbi:unnamed protein product [Ilex paraguariensis]|uniref:AP-2 complex subunit sigma n=1 Tax=Ilex paraguariensis TaxID=185542 RepID=A0ABC8RTW0_9AQUA
MIRFILLQNRQGKTRLAKYYIPLEESEKHKVEYEVHRLVVNRDPKFTNFVEFRTHKVIYRRYAGLFFSLCVDITDNELAYLECIHLFVEILDHFFSNVCELDLVFNFHKVYLILDEFILAGELQETSKKVWIVSEFLLFSACVWNQKFQNSFSSLIAGNNMQINLVTIVAHFCCFQNYNGGANLIICLLSNSRL